MKTIKKNNSSLGGVITASEFENNLYNFLQSKKWTLKQAKILSGGGITKQNKKMPFYNYDLSAWDCKKGSQLRNVKNSVCGSCYAMKGNYLRYKNGSVGRSHELHLKSLDNNFDWVIAMAYQIIHYKTKYFRFHASGDLQSVDHAIQIINLARLTPSTSYWIPTREISFIKEIQKRNISIPKNCIFRISAPLVDGFLNSKVFNNTSSVITDSKKAIGKICPSSKQGGQCLDCRACWNFKETNINYLIH